MISRRSLLAFLGLAPLAPTIPAVADAAAPQVPEPVLADTDSYIGHGIVGWSDYRPDSMFFVTVKNLSTKEVTTATTTGNVFRFPVRDRFHHFKVTVAAITRDGSKQYTPHYTLDFADGDPVDMFA